MIDRYSMFRRLLDFVESYGNITDADMYNYADEIEVSGISAEGSTITIRVEIKEEDDIDA